MNIFKLITRKGRRAYVRAQLVEYITKDRLAELTASGVTSLIESSCKSISDDGMKLLCDRCAAGAAVFSSVADAVSDKVVTKSEVDGIAKSAESLVGEIISQARIDAVIDAIVERVP